MKTLYSTLELLLKQTGFDALSDFALSKEIVYKKDSQIYLHTFNYLAQTFNELTYLEINPVCEGFNSEFWDTKDCELTLEHYKWLAQNEFGYYSQEVQLQAFSNQILDMDFFPQIKGYFIMDKEGNHYMLVSFAKYNSQEFT